MFSRLFQWLAGKPAARPPSKPAATGDILASAEDLYWIKADDNPWRVDILDCRPLVVRWKSATYDMNTFDRLRKSDGRQHIGAEPLPNRLDGSLKFDIPVAAPEGILWRAQLLEHKWDIYHYDGRLYVARSWTGELRYSAAMRCDGQITILEDIHSHWADAVYSKKELHFLFAGLCQESLMPAPLPVQDMPDPENLGEKALAGHHLLSTFGCYGWFATVADLTESTPVPFEELKQWLEAHPPPAEA